MPLRILSSAFCTSSKIPGICVSIERVPMSPITQGILTA